MRISALIKKIFQLYNLYFAMKDLRNIHSSENGKVVVINTVRCYYIQLCEEMYYALLMASRGYQVHVLLDDGMLSHWDAIQDTHNYGYLTVYQMKGLKKYYHLMLKEFVLWAYSHENIRITYYSEILGTMGSDPNDLDSVEVGHAKTSVRRYFQTGEFEDQSESQHKYFKLSLNNAKIAKIVGKYIVEKIKPDLFLTSHAIYATWGVCHHYVKKSNIPAITYLGHAYQPGKTIFTEVKSQLLSEDSDWLHFRNKQLTVEQKQKVVDYFTTRLNIKASDNKIYFSDDFLAYDHVKKGDGYLVYGVFPNVVWDSDTEEKHLQFRSIIEWLVTTVDVFRKNKNHLIIRFHPSEATLFTQAKKLEYVLHNKIPDLYEIKNVHIISSNEKINTYKLLSQSIDIGIVYDGMLAFELPVMDIPVISCSMSRYYKTGFSFEPENKEEYIQWLLCGDEVIRKFKYSKKKIMENLYKFTYWYIFSVGICNPIYLKDKAFSIGIFKNRKNKYNYNHDQNPLNLINKIESFLIKKE